MKPLIAKELRECRKLAVLGAAVYVFVLTLTCLNYNRAIALLIARSADGPIQTLLPLVDPQLRMWIGVLCAVFAAALGGWQLFTERQRNLWSCLLHRPLTPTQVFLAKIIPGLGFYFAAAGLPLVGFVLWNAAPGNVAGPFEWGMAIPLVILCLGGLPWYFAAMLAGVRRARWYASRIVGFGTALVTSGAMVGAPRLGYAVVAILVGTLVLATASWAAFHTNGEDRRQPAPGKPALALSLALGWSVAVFFLGVIVADVVGRVVGYPSPQAYYSILKHGTLVKVTQDSNQVTQVVDQEGRPILHPKTGQPVSTSDFHTLLASSRGVYVASPEDRPVLPWFYASLSTRTWRVSSGVLWFVWKRCDRLEGYDLRTRRFIGSLGPKGFAGDPAGGGDHFKEFGTRALTGPDGIYLVDLPNRSIRPIFSAAPDDPLLAATEVYQDSEWTHLVVATKQSVRLLLPDGGEVFKAPFAPGPPNYRQVYFYALEPAGQFALWFHPVFDADARDAWKLPVHVVFLSGQTITREVDLPALALDLGRADAETKTMSTAVPPLAILVVGWVSHGLSLPRTQTMLIISFAVGVITCLPAFWLMRRNRLPLSEQVAWVCLLLLFGIAGFCAFLSAQTWPALVPCASCRKRRVVTRDRCEHCGAGFPPPDRKGIEIFEPVGARERAETNVGLAPVGHQSL